MTRKILNLIVGLIKIPVEMVWIFATLMTAALYAPFLVAYDGIRRLVVEFRYTP